MKNILLTYFKQLFCNHKLSIFRGDENHLYGCKKCGKKLVLPARAYLNLERYKVGGSVMVASECCNSGYIVKMNVSYSTTEYEGSATEDDWGIPIKNIKK